MKPQPSLTIIELPQSGILKIFTSAEENFDWVRANVARYGTLNYLVSRHQKMWLLEVYPAYNFCEVAEYIRTMGD